MSPADPAPHSSNDSRLEWINNLDRDRAHTELTRCCGSARWVLAMDQRRPFLSREHLIGSADEVWRTLTPEDWMEAFDHHPRIGDRITLGGKFASTNTWAREEQSGAGDVAQEMLAQLAEANAKYEEKFGFIFIVCATGRTAAAMLKNLRERLENPADLEISIAAEEQRKITQLRLEKLLSWEIP